jgi:hypothetical protein
MKKTIIYDPKNGTGKVLAQALTFLDRSFLVTESVDEVMQTADEETIDSILMVVDDKDDIHTGNQLSKKCFDTPVLFATNPKLGNDLTSRLNGEHYSTLRLPLIALGLAKQLPIKKILEKDYGFAFEADPQGLTRVLMDQFSQPLLCFRELVQNSADAEASRIDINTHYDTEKELLSVSVNDDGCGMNLDQIMIYLTLFDSTKDTNIKKIGQMGAGKVFAHALGPELTVVETGDGQEGHKVIFNPDLSGRIVTSEPYQGTDVQLLLPMKRYKARAFNKELDTIVRKWCQYIETPLMVNGEKVNKPFELPGKYVINLKEEGLNAVISPSINFHGFGLYKGGILLENQAFIDSNRYEKGNIMGSFSGLIDANIFDFPISRNGVVCNDDYNSLFKRLKKVIVQEYTPLFLRDYQKKSTSLVHKNMMTDYFHCVIANHGYSCLEEKTLEEINQLPLIENVDGKMLSVSEVRGHLQQSNCLYYTNNGLSSQELASFLDKGIPVLKSPGHMVLYNILGNYNNQCLDSKYYRGSTSRAIGVFNFDSIGSLLRKGFVQKVSSNFFSGSGGGSGMTTNQDGTFDNPFDFNRLQIYGAEFKDLDGNPNENVLLDSHSEGMGYSRLHKVIFNVHHPFMKKMETLYHRNETYAQYLIACELVQSEKVFGNVSHKLREHEMSRIGLKVLDYD